MPRLLACLTFLLLAACQSPDPAPQGAPIPRDALPFTVRSARFRDGRGLERQVTVEPAPDGHSAVMTVTGSDIPARRIDLLEDGDSIRFRTGPGDGTELLRVGARPGDTWTSGPDRVSFDGWQRVEVPAGQFDALRVTTTRGPESLQRVESWWFTPGVGLVRLRSDHGGIFVEEMWLVDPPAGPDR